MGFNIYIFRKIEYKYLTLKGGMYSQRLKVDNNKEDYSNYILVIGVDRKQHLALPWENTCKCGCELHTTLKSDGFLFSLQRLNLHNQLTNN